MNEIITFLGTNLFLIALFSIIGIFIKWLFIKSAVKAGTKEAILEILKDTGYRQTLEEYQQKQLQKEIEEEMESWN